MSGSEAAGGRQGRGRERGGCAGVRSGPAALLLQRAMEKCLVGGRMSKPWAGSGKEAAASRSACLSLLAAAMSRWEWRVKEHWVSLIAAPGWILLREEESGETESG